MKSVKQTHSEARKAKHYSGLTSTKHAHANMCTEELCSKNTVTFTCWSIILHDRIHKCKMLDQHVMVQFLVKGHHQHQFCCVYRTTMQKYHQWSHDRFDQANLPKYGKLRLTLNTGRQHAWKYHIMILSRLRQKYPYIHVLSLNSRTRVISSHSCHIAKHYVAWSWLCRVLSLKSITHCDITFNISRH